MEFKFVGKDTVISENLKEKVVSRLSKLEEMVPENTEVKVTFKVVKNENKIEVKLPLNKRLLRATAKSDSMYNAIDDVYHKLERQVKKYKGRLKKHSKGNKLFQNEFDMLSKEIQFEETQDKVIKVKKFEFKPMTVEEAILEMELVGHSFFIFKDANSDTIKVVYKRDEGQYSVIEES